MRFLIGEIGRHRVPLARLAGWTLLEALPPLLSGQLFAAALDRGFVAGRPLTGAAYLLAACALFAAAAQATRRCYPPVAIIVESLRDVLLRRVVGATLHRAAVHDQPDAGAVSRITQQVETVRDVVAGLLLIFRRVVVSICAAVVGLFLLDRTVFIFVVPPLALAIVAFALIMSVLARRRRDVLLADEDVAASAASAVDGVRDVVACGAERHAGNLVGADIDRHFHAARALAHTNVLCAPVIGLGAYVPVILLLVAAPSLRGNGLTVGVLLGAIVYVTTSLEPALRSLVQSVGTSGLRLSVAIGRLAETTRMPVSLSPKANAECHGHGIELAGVTFAYGAHAQPVIDDLHLTVPPGAHLAVVGPSGIGKSTLANLIAGIVRPQSGGVHIGGSPVTDCRMVTLIPQEAYVFAGTLWENLTYLRPDASEHEVGSAGKLFGLEPLTARLGGLHEQLSPTTLSAGERQLIALARAYLSPNPVIVLDEATCHLDPVAEARAEEAFAARPGTLIVIAHRITSALRAQQILLMGDTETLLGTHESLLDESALYRDLTGLWDPLNSTTATAT